MGKRLLLAVVVQLCRTTTKASAALDSLCSRLPELLRLEQLTERVYGPQPCCSGSDVVAQPAALQPDEHQLCLLNQCAADLEAAPDVAAATAQEMAKIRLHDSELVGCLVCRRCNASYPADTVMVQPDWYDCPAQQVAHHQADERTVAVTDSPHGDSRSIVLTHTSTSLGRAWVARLVEHRGATNLMVARLGRKCGEVDLDVAITKAQAALVALDSAGGS